MTPWLAVTLLAAGAEATPALAPEPAPPVVEDLSDLEGLLDTSVVSTASQTAETESLAPALTSVITAEDLRRYGIRSLDQALDYLGLGVFTEPAYGVGDVGARGVIIAGDYGNHMLLLIDGHAVNEPWAGSAYFDEGVGLPMEVVDHIEIILGPGSVLYGSSAMQGVINVVTKRAKDYAGAHLVLESEVPISGRGVVGYGGRFELLGREGELTVAAQYLRSEGPTLNIAAQDYGADAVTGEPVQWGEHRAADGIWGGEARNGVYVKNPGGTARLLWGDFQLGLRASEITRGVPFSSYANFDDPDSLERDRWASADLRWQRQLSDHLQATARLFGDLYSYREVLPTLAAQSCLGGMEAGCVWSLDGSGRRVGAGVAAQIDWFADGRFATLVGADGHLRRVASEDLYEANDTGARDSTTEYQKQERGGAVYAQQTARLTSWLAANAGARLDLDDRYGTHVSPRAAVVLTPWEGGSLKALYAEAFRAPSAFETYYGDETFQVPAHDLQPEVVRSLEAVIEQRVGGHRLQLGAFLARWQDLVESQDLSDAEIAEAIDRGELEPFVDEAIEFKNVASLRSYGGTVAYSGSTLQRRLSFGLGATVSRTQRGGDAADDPISLSPTWVGNARVAYVFGGPLPTLALAIRAIDQRVVEGAGSGFDPIPEAPRQVNARLTLSGALPGYAALGYRLSADAALAKHTAYAIGPLDGPSGDYTRQALAPADRFRVMVGLSYDLAP